MHKNKATLMIKYTITFLTAIFGGLIFKLIHIPVPWLLGPMTVMIIGTNGFNYQFKWNAHLRSAGMMMIGYTIGVSMTVQALSAMTVHIPYMLFVSIILIALCAVIAYFIFRVSSNDYNTTLLASIPGGLSQVLLLAEEIKGINIAVVTITQVIRVMLIIISMPLLVMIPFFKENGQTEMTADLMEPSQVNLFPSIFLFIMAAIIFTIILVKIKFPTAVLLGPMLGTVFLQLLGIDGPTLPDMLTNIAQLLIGIHVGLMLHIADVPDKIRTISLAFLSGVLLIIGSILFSLLLTYFQSLSHATSLLSLAPGGMDQMGIIAHEIDADLSIVSGYQLFRTLFIYFAIPPMMKLFFKKAHLKNRINKQS